MNREAQLGPREKALKAAFVRLVEHCGGLRVARAITGKSEPSLSNYGNPQVDTMPPIDVVLALECVAGSGLVTDLMAELRGNALPAAPSGPSWAVGLGDVSQRFADVARSVADAMQDGVISETERRSLEQYTAAMVLAAQQMHAMAMVGSAPAGGAA